MAADKKEGQQPAKKLNIALILTGAFAVVNLGVIGGGAYMAYLGTLGFHHPKITEQQLVDEKERSHVEQQENSGPLLYTMDKFTVNLDGEPRRVARLEINLEMLNKDGFEEIINVDNRARARDRIVQILNSKTFADLESIQGKLFLKDQIAEELNSLLDVGVVKEVYFTEFAVQ